MHLLCSVGYGNDGNIIRTDLLLNMYDIIKGFQQNAVAIKTILRSLNSVYYFHG